MANDGNPALAGALRFEALGALVDAENLLDAADPLIDGCDWSIVWVPPVNGACHQCDADADWSLFESKNEEKNFLWELDFNNCNLWTGLATLYHFFIATGYKRALTLCTYFFLKWLLIKFDKESSKLMPYFRCGGTSYIYN